MSTSRVSTNSGAVALDSAIRRAIVCCRRESSSTVVSPRPVAPSPDDRLRDLALRLPPPRAPPGPLLAPPRPLLAVLGGGLDVGLDDPPAGAGALQRRARRRGPAPCGARSGRLDAAVAALVRPPGSAPAWSRLVGAPRVLGRAVLGLGTFRPPARGASCSSAPRPPAGRGLLACCSPPPPLADRARSSRRPQRVALLGDDLEHALLVGLVGHVGLVGLDLDEIVAHLTSSPSDFSHFRIVPSSIESDRRGIATSAMPISVYGVNASTARRTVRSARGSRATSNQKPLIAWTSRVKSSRSSGLTTLAVDAAVVRGGDVARRRRRGEHDHRRARSAGSRLISSSTSRPFFLERKGGSPLGSSWGTGERGEADRRGRWRDVTGLSQV